MDISSEKIGRVTVCCLSGRLDASTAALVQERMSGILESDCQVLVGDLAGLEYVSSAGLRVFLLQAKDMARRGGRMGLYALQPSVRQVFEISGFHKIVPVFESREEALVSLGG